MTHFEKMLEDNARLLSVYLHAYLVTGRELYRETARSMVEYINTTLFDKERGYFYGSQDGDEPYYGLSKAERAKLPAPYVDRNLYTDWNALMASAYIEAARVLDDESLQSTAIEVLANLVSEMLEPEHALYHSRRAGEDKPQLPGQLVDHAYTALALIELAQPPRVRRTSPAR